MPANLELILLTAGAIVIGWLAATLAWLSVGAARVSDSFELGFGAHLVTPLLTLWPLVLVVAVVWFSPRVIAGLDRIEGIVARRRHHGRMMNGA